VHLDDNEGPRVLTDTFEPYSDANRDQLTKTQRQFCKNLTDEQKALIRARQASVFETGVLPALGLLDLFLSVLNGDDPMAAGNQQFREMFPDPNTVY
jgi:hypothetical protein